MDDKTREALLPIYKKLEALEQEVARVADPVWEVVLFFEGGGTFEEAIKKWDIDDITLAKGYLCVSEAREDLEILTDPLFESRSRRGRMLKEWYQASEEEVERRKKNLVGKLLKNIYIDGEYGYRSEGICTSVDDSGQIHGTWGVAIQPGTDSFAVGSDEDLANYNRKKAEPQENTRKYFDDVKVTITPRKGYGLAAKIDCVYHGQEVKNIKVYEGAKGPFVGYPTWDVIAVDPSQKTIRNIWGGCWREFEKEVIKEYNKAMEEKNESLLRHGRMLKEEDERVSLDVSYFDGWSEDGKNYAELEVKKNGENTPVNVCVVFTDKGEHLDTVFYIRQYISYTRLDNLTENEVAEKLDVSVGDIKKLVEKAKIKAMKEFE